MIEKYFEDATDSEEEVNWVIVLSEEEEMEELVAIIKTIIRGYFMKRLGKELISG